MNEQEYLNQISASVRPTKPKHQNNFLASPFFKVGAIGLIALFIIILIGSIISSGKPDLKTQNIKLKLHLENTAAVISEYQKYVKSSDLRSSSASLYSVLTNTYREVENYLTNKFSYKANSESKKLQEQAKLEQDNLSADLFEAKINGLLDRIFAHKAVYEITLIVNEERTIYHETSDANYKSVLQSSIDSLDTLYDKFNNFSAN